MRYKEDKRAVMTLDAGGTNLVFSAMMGGEEIVERINLSARRDNLELFLQSIIDGFEEVQSKLSQKPVAISFCFPGPAEYEDGIIGDLENLPVFRDGVALGPMLEDIFQIPVFINNDGDLFAYGEAVAGLLPEVNALLAKSGSPKRYRNLFGATFGTGFGGGIVHRGELFLGDNSAQGEINRTRNKILCDCSVEETVSIRGVRRMYAREAGIKIVNSPSPKGIFEIGMGWKKGDKKAACKAFEEFAIVAGDAFANAISLIDGLIVIGGGLSMAYPLFLQRLVDEMNTQYTTTLGTSLNRLEVKAFNLENKYSLMQFIKGDTREITVPFSDRKIKYDPLKRMGVGITRLGTANAVAIGAYAFALNQLDR
jgi:glucokinase